MEFSHFWWVHWQTRDTVLLEDIWNWKYGTFNKNVIPKSSDTQHRGDKCVSAAAKLHLYCATVISLYFYDRTFSYLSKQDLKKLSWLLMNSFWEYVKRLRTDHLWLLRSNLLGNVLEAKPTRWKDLMWAFQNGGKKNTEMLLEKRWNIRSSDTAALKGWLDQNC